ncbi:MAG TPA: Ni/Fe hydrogenase subunit alpha [Nitrososphaerales archaeon]|nr:Ni/Fe hydrogenase subunit alpha [Nitrososphaerales archaeon]
MTRRVVVDTGPLARVEGEGSLSIVDTGTGTPEVRLNIFEPPRFFEAFLRGRRAEEIPDLVSRICGICPVAYQVSSLNAFEGLFGVEVDEQVRRLRRILYYGEWIESHALHVFMLAAPDFVGVPDAVAMVERNPGVVKEALSLKRFGNDVMSAIGGREIHPVSLKIGGVHRAPSKEALSSLLPELDRLRGSVGNLVAFVSSLQKPSLERESTLVCLHDPARYAIDCGEISSNSGPCVPPSSFEESFEEYQVSYSNALHSRTKGGGSYMVGPLARFSLNFEQLNPVARAMARDMGLKPPLKDPFQSILVRVLEIVHALEETAGEVREYEEPPRPSTPYKPKAGVCHGVSEAPRGILYHSYAVNARGQVERAKIVPPTAQNQSRMEDDIRLLVPQIMESDANGARRLGEMAVRNYDPCISCATHFLRLDIQKALA